MMYLLTSKHCEVKEVEVWSAVSVTISSRSDNATNVT